MPDGDALSTCIAPAQRIQKERAIGAPLRANTKRSPSAKARWFDYYAGYPTAFVEAALNHLALGEGALVVDPWNGSGTTTTVLQERGMAGSGFDINPAITLVAKARLAHNDEIRRGIKALFRRIDSQLSDERPISEEDPLLAWFTPSAAATFRGMQKAIWTTVGRTAAPSTQTMFDDLPAHAAYYYTALFRTARAFLEQFQTTNPTWMSRPSHKSRRRGPQRDRVTAAFSNTLGGMLAQDRRFRSGFTKNDNVQARIADAGKLPLFDDSVDAIITSPPYCTRIDYPMATRIELALLDHSEDAVRVLRRASLGSTLSAPSLLPLDASWGPTAIRFMERVRQHPSKASPTYYLRCYATYFDGLLSSVRSISRVLRPRASAVVVVQDSYYKEIHCNLQTILTEIAATSSLALESRHDASVASTKASMNPRARNYRKDHRATETTLIFRKRESTAAALSLARKRSDVKL